MTFTFSTLPEAYSAKTWLWLMQSACSLKLVFSKGERTEKVKITILSTMYNNT